MKKWVVFLTVLSFLISGNAIADINDGLLAHYPFDGDVSDASGNGFDGIVNGATYTENGYKGGAYHFNGLHGHIDTIPKAQILSQITVSMWIKRVISYGVAGSKPWAVRMAILGI
jgi:expansin (peptidoglycan-binding protein)